MKSKIDRRRYGGEVLEYALILGLIVVACVAVIGAVGGKYVEKWKTGASTQPTDESHLTYPLKG